MGINIRGIAKGHTIRYKRAVLSAYGTSRASANNHSWILTPVRSYLNYINEHHVFSEPINTEKFQWTGQVLPSKRQLINRVERLEKELEDLKNILATYDYDRREIEA